MQAIQEKVDFSFAKVARKLGRKARHYRLVDPLSPLSMPCGMSCLCVDLDHGFRLRRPRGWAQAMAYGISDAALRTGDLFEQDDCFYFVAQTEPLRPALLVCCNRLVSVTGMRGAEGLYVARCPASLRLTGKGDDRRSGMPGAVRSGSYMLHLPLLPGFCLMPYMQVTDEIGARYLIDAVERSECGFRAVLSMQQV
ncbi:hypothetical protein ACFFGF_06935 [Asaia lannensis]|uniref:Uncharacterized protein n=1 Tax=Asaia lannensis NBRC 102526 TaxID=1307926 RepID=A0ABT1CJ88_9PROT|nr:hypothetical protein [Asaia lannensis]MCO6160806.1 hypothetical protein [Asaia lannensis NBRC 102526]GBQ94581.1 hypothetical protein AA102526_0127 [Asaia lannensis NBRC 102526]